MGFITEEFTKDKERRKKEKQLEKKRDVYLNATSYRRIEIITTETSVAPYCVIDAFHSTPAEDIMALAMLRHVAEDLKANILKKSENITEEELEKDIKELTEIFST